MPKITINGKTVEVKEGSSVIQACKEAGVPVAHYCWHEGLSVAGVCRMCMVEVEKMPKLQIACNTPVTEGMVVRTDSEKVKETVKWTLDFHLINHPLDCPICDQAGECKLQDYYMSYGLYKPEMNQRKVKKSKAVSLGDKVVLDQERCILCSRCVRFTSEVTKTHELGIFNRGDRSVVASFEGRPMQNNYQVNTVDICPVGALTSKDFRFKQRVWFLKNASSVCNGCSTGCNITVGFNKNGVFRVRPRANNDVNGFWMCDDGREIYKYVNKEYRQDHSVDRDHESTGGAPKATALILQDYVKELQSCVERQGPQSVAVVLTAQYTVEEYERIFNFFFKNLKVQNFFHWKNNEGTFEAFDGLLLRGDKNPNTQGLLKVFGKNLKPWSDFEKAAIKGEFKMTFVAAPENLAVFDDLEKRVSTLKKGGHVACVTSCESDLFAGFRWIIAGKSFCEKSGTFINYKGLEQKIEAFTEIIPSGTAVSLSDFVGLAEETIGGRTS